MKKTKIILSDNSGFSLIEIMVVVTIMGILALAVAVNVIDFVGDAKVNTAKTDISSIETALGLFKLQNGFYPSTEQGLEALVEKPTTGEIPSKWKEGGYLKDLKNDPWGNPYVYLCPGVNGPFDLESYGQDGEDGGDGDDADIENWSMNDPANDDQQ